MQSARLSISGGNRFFAKGGNHVANKLKNRILARLEHAPQDQHPCRKEHPEKEGVKRMPSVPTGENQNRQCRKNQEDRSCTAGSRYPPGQQGQGEYGAGVHHEAQRLAGQQFRRQERPALHVGERINQHEAVIVQVTPEVPEEPEQEGRKKQGQDEKP